MELEKLENIGLSLNEAKIYISLLNLKHAQAGEISKHSQINRTTTYDSLERLIEKGIVSYVIESGKKVFTPSDPSILLERLREKEESIKKILPELKKRLKEIREEEESNIFKGKKGIKSILNEILTHKEYVAFGSAGKFLEVMKHDFVIFQKEKKRLKIKSRVIQSDSVRKDKELKRIAYATFRYIPDEYLVPNTTIVYGNKIAFIVWGELPLATVITSKSVADSFRNYFKLLWKQAKA